MTQPIPLHVLCAYLPYNTKILVSHRTQPDFESTLLPAHIGDPSGIALKLRPLSDLSKPLAELEGKTALEALVDLLNGLGYAWPKAKIQSNENFEERGIFIAIANDSSLSFRLSPDFYMLPMEAVMKVRELLLSLHFDLFNCLVNGWALDLNQSPS